MRSFVLSLAATLAFAGGAFAQTTSARSNLPEVLRGTSNNPGAEPSTKNTAKPAAQKASVAHSVQRPPAAKRTTPQTLRASRYGGFAPAPALPPPQLDTTSPRSLNLVNVNSGEVLSVTYWSDGTYRRDALDKLNHFLRDTRDNAQTEMDPLLFDVLWHTTMIVGYGGSIEVLSAYRSPTTNAWLASVSRGVANDSQHINGNAMDIRFPGVPVFRIRQAAQALNMGGVGFYPRSGFVHLDTGPVRYW
jgi:uncharacterized protein YcbK (DUF882 family)